MRLSGRPSPPPYPHPQRGRGKKQGEGSAARPLGRRAGAGSGVSGPRPPGARAQGGRGVPAPQPGAQPAPGRDSRSADPGTWLEFSAIKVHLVCAACPAPRSPGKFRSSGSRWGPGRSPRSPPTPRAPRKARGSSAASRHRGEREGLAGQGSSLSPPLLYLPPPAAVGRRGPWAKPGRSARRARGEAEPLSRSRPEGAGGGQRLRQGHPRVAPASTG